MLYLGEHKWVVALRERLGIAKPELFVFGDGSYKMSSGWVVSKGRDVIIHIG